jgi:hypothetical protein
MLIVVTPFLAPIDGPVIQGIVAIVAVSTLATAAWSIPQGEEHYLSRVVAPFAICLSLPAVWMVIQAAPLPFKTITNPIWTSVQAALGEPRTGSISIDPGITLVAVMRYLIISAIVIATTVVAVNRRSAQMLLLALAVATALAAIMVLASGFAGLPLVDQARYRLISGTWVAECLLGLPIAASAIGHLLEPERTPSKARGSPLRSALLISYVGALAICFGALLFAASTRSLLIAFCGLGMIIGVGIVRRLGISPWSSAAFAATSVVIFAAMVSVHTDQRRDLTLRYADSPAWKVAIAERIMADTSWAGSGGGVFDAMIPFYSEIDGNREVGSAPTAAAEMAIELGKPVLWITTAMVAFALGRLIRGALTRRRDWMYPLAAASSILIYALMAFTSSNVFATPVALLAAATFGLGIAQSVSRSSLK